MENNYILIRVYRVRQWLAEWPTEWPAEWLAESTELLRRFYMCSLRPHYYKFFGWEGFGASTT